MQTKCLKSLKITLGIIGTFHLLIGLFSLIPYIPKAQIASVVYKATIDPTPQLMHVAEMAGCYMFTVGFITLLALRDPIKNVIVIYGLIALLSLRVISIILFSGQSYAVFGIPPFWYWTNCVVTAALLGALICLKPKPG